jgi:hypothetical protein
VRNLLPAAVRSSRSAYLSNVKIKVACSSETSVNIYQTTTRHVLDVVYGVCIVASSFLCFSCGLVRMYLPFPATEISSCFEEIVIDNILLVMNFSSLLYESYPG